MGAAIGVGITTHNRPEILDRSLEHWRKHLPEGAVLVVVDDGSDEPVKGADFRHETPLGIAAAKNRCIELLADADVHHMFLADDDTWPISDNWWRPYVESPMPHLMYLFKDPTPRGYAATPPLVYSDEQHFAYSHPRGCLLYINSRLVLPKVGGLDPGYGRWGWEHVDWSQRIYNAGLTRAPFMDVNGSSELWHSMDEHWFSEQIVRSVPPNERKNLVRLGEYRFQTLRDQERWIDWKSDPAPISNERYVVTFLLNGTPDTQRNVTWEADPSLVDEWAKSIAGATPVVVSDCIDSHPHAKVIRVEPLPMNVYFARWAHAARLLAEGHFHPRSHLFFTDGTDVTMARSPWGQMRQGRIYTGVEPCTVSTPWMRNNMADPAVKRFIRNNPDLPLLNAGVVGGEAYLVEKFIRDMLAVYYNEPNQGAGDNGALNLVAYSAKWLGQIETGPRVTNTFKSYKDNGTCWFMHK